MAFTRGATSHASSSASGPVTWITCMIATPGSAARRSLYVPLVSRSTSWSVLTPAARCCATIPLASCRLVSSTDATPGGITRAICAMRSSAITPGPLGIAETSPSADAPCRIAVHASSTLPMQQTFTRGVTVGSIGPSSWPLFSPPRRQGDAKDAKSEVCLSP